MNQKIIKEVNEYKKRRLLVHDKLYRIKIEPSLGCNRNCKFCGMTRKDRHIMTMKVFDTILERIPLTVKRVEFILHGEPTLNPNLLGFFRKVKDKSPHFQIAVSTNGWAFLNKKENPDYLFEMFKSGANIVQLSLYDKESYESFKNIVNSNIKKIEEMQITLDNLYGTHKNLFCYRGSKKRQLLYIEEFQGLNSGQSQQRRFHTFGGNVPVDLWKNYSNKTTNFDKFPMTGKGKTCCSLLKYISIGAKGDLYMCCRDASHSIKLPNIEDIDLQDFWESDTVSILKLVTKSARRDLIAPCFLCSRFCYRDPLYPYWGKGYTESECIELIDDITFLSDDVLLDNLIKFREVYPERIPEHIQREISKGESRLKLKTYNEGDL